MRTLPIIAAPGAQPEPPEPASVAESRAPSRDLQEGDLFPLLEAFYATVAADPLLAPYFTQVDMAAHMPRIVDFWSTTLFHTGRYAGSAFRPHMEMPGLTAEHFARWVATLEATVDAHVAGEAAEGMKALAHRIAYSMQLRLGISPFAPYRYVTE